MNCCFLLFHGRFVSSPDLTIVVSGETDVVLPVNRVQLFASSWPDPPSLDYHWSRVFGPKEGELSGMNDAAVTLSEVKKIPLLLEDVLANGLSTRYGVYLLLASFKGEIGNQREIGFNKTEVTLKLHIKYFRIFSL